MTKSIKKLYTVDQFYDLVIVKDKKLTWKCPICNEECRFLNQHLQRKHKIDFFTFFKDNVDYSCQFCNKNKSITEIKWDRLKVSKSSLDHSECVKNYKKSLIKERYCLNCDKPIARHSLKFCSYSCSNMYRHKDLDFCIKHATSIKNSYNKGNLREIRKNQEKSKNNSFVRTGRQPKRKMHYNKHFSLDWHLSEQVNKVLNEMKDEGKSFLRKFQSKAERDFILYLLDKEIDFIYQFKIENKIFDFYFPDYNLILELDGSYFHNLDPNSDIIKTNLAIDNGYNFCRFSTNCKNYDYYFLDFNWENNYED